MNVKIDFFEDGDYKFISNLINEKMFILRECKEFDEQYLKLYNVMEELEDTLEDKQKEKFNEIIRLFYGIEEYYFALAYSIGVKYGKDLEKI